MTSEDRSSKDELRELNEAIAVAEKRLIGASRNLMYLYGADGDATTAALEEESDEERVACDRLLVSYGEVLDALTETSQSHEQNVVALQKTLSDTLQKHKQAREQLTNSLLSLKLSLLSKREQKTVNHEELLRGAKRQEEMEQTVIKLRMLNLSAETTGQAEPKTSLKEMVTREKHEDVTQQLVQLRQLVARQEADKLRKSCKQNDHLSRKKALEHKMRTLLSDREMARLEYADMCNEYRYEQSFNRTLKERVEKARSSRYLTELVPRHKEVICNVVTLDSAAKKASEKCASLHRTLIRTERR